VGTGLKLLKKFLNRTEIYEMGHYVKKFWPGGTHLDTQLPPTPPGNRLNCFLSRQYISPRTLSFLVTKAIRYVYSVLSFPFCISHCIWCPN